MRYLFALLVVLSGCTVKHTFLKRSLAVGSVIEVNSYGQKVEKQLYIRLHSYPVYGLSCFVETSGVCKYGYYMSVSTFDEYPEINLYELDFEGEVIDITWQYTDIVDEAIVSLTIREYAKAALENNKSLGVNSRVITYKVGTNSIEVLP